MARKPAKPESSPHKPDASHQPAANAASQDTPAAGASAQAQATDEPPPATSVTEAPATTAGASRTADAEIERQPQPATVDVSFPLPAGVPDAVLDASFVVVKAKPAIGRWRAGRKFTREETAIPYRDLDEKQIAALTGDPELTVSLRVPRGEPG